MKTYNVRLQLETENPSRRHLYYINPIENYSDIVHFSQLRSNTSFHLACRLEVWQDRSLARYKSSKIEYFLDR